MIKAFVFGKFLPFHKGHEAMIEFALQKCDYLTVLICCSDKEAIPASTRYHWLSETFKGNSKIKIQVLDYLETELPNTSVSSSEVSKIWAAKFKELLPGHSLLITSEPYGDFVAGFMNIEHIPFDIPREKFPVSATKIRTDSIANWNYIPDKVKDYYIKKIVILGTESTGKTTLTNNLAKHFQASSVLEAGREVIHDSKSFSLEDLYTVATEHSKNINLAITGESPLLIIDTDIHITQSYANYVFNTALNLPEVVYETNKADLYLYLSKDIEFVQDGTRLNESDRNLLDASHKKILAHHNITYHEIDGNWEERFEKSVKLIQRFLKN